MTMLENPIWIIVTGIGVTVAAGVAYHHTRHKGFAWGMLAAVVVTVALVVTEQLVETDREQLREAVLKMAKAVQDNDIEGILSFVPPTMEETRARIESEMPSYTFERCRVMRFNAMEFDSDKHPRRAKLVFSVWVDVNSRRHDYDGPARRRVILFFQKIDGQWQLTDYDHEDPSVSSPYLADDRQETFEADAW